MKGKLSLIFQIASVFVGTIVGAGLASGKEITQFFTDYGFPSFIGMILCCVIYVVIGSIITDVSIRHDLKSYNEFITFVSPGLLGKVTDVITSLFLLSSCAIILAGSGALIHQYFGVSKWVGIALMSILSIVALLRNTEGLISVNTIIVPCTITAILCIFILYVIFYGDMISIKYLSSIPKTKSNWIISTILYAGFNLLCCSGVLVPLSQEIKKKRSISIGIAIGASILTLLCVFINIMLMLNVPYIHQYEIPLLYITNRFGKPIQIVLLVIIWFEMFSTVVSDIYSIGKAIEHKFNMKFLTSILIVLIVALPISTIGFGNLISVLYPAFGIVSLIFMCQLIFFYCVKEK